MATVGVRQLRAELSHWLKKAEGGEEVLITQRGKAIARLSAAAGRSRIEALIAAGLITPPAQPKQSRKSFRRIRARGSVSDLIYPQSE